MRVPRHREHRDLTREHVDNRLLRAGLSALVTRAEELASHGLEEAANRTLDGYIALVQASTPRLIVPANAPELIAFARLLQT